MEPLTNNNIVTTMQIKVIVLFKFALLRFHNFVHVSVFIFNIAFMG